MGTIKHVEIQTYGEILGTALTGSYQTILTIPDDIRFLFVFNDCDNHVILSLPTEVANTDCFKLKRENFVWDLRIGNLQIKSGDIKVKHAGAGSTSGSIRVTVAR